MAAHLDAFAAAMRAIVGGSLVTEPDTVPAGDWPLLACTAARVDNVAALVQAVTCAGGGAGLDAPALVPHHFFLVRLAEAAGARHVLGWLHREAPHVVAHYTTRRPRAPALHSAPL